MTLLTYALTTVAAVKLQLGITDSDSDDIIEQLINAATRAIEKECHRRFKQTAHVDEMTAHGGKDLVLLNYPILEDGDGGSPTPADVVVKTVQVDASEDTVDEDTYRVVKDRGILNRPAGWPRGDFLLEVTYTAGYATIPEDVAQACIDVVARSFNTTKSAGIKSESIGTYTITYDDVKDGMKASVLAQQIIDSYKTNEI